MPPDQRPDLRRRDDTKINSLSTDVAVLKSNLEYIKESVDSLADDVRAALSKQDQYSSDPTASAAGREMVRRVNNAEVLLADHDKGIERLEKFQGDVEVSLRLILRSLTILGTVVGIIGGVLGIVGTLHLLGAV